MHNIITNSYVIQAEEVAHYRGHYNTLCGLNFSVSIFTSRDNQEPKFSVYLKFACFYIILKFYTIFRDVLSVMDYMYSLHNLFSQLYSILLYE